MNGRTQRCLIYCCIWIVNKSLDMDFSSSVIFNSTALKLYAVNLAFFFLQAVVQHMAFVLFGLGKDSRPSCLFGSGVPSKMKEAINIYFGFLVFYLIVQSVGDWCLSLGRRL